VVPNFTQESHLVRIIHCLTEGFRRPNEVDLGNNRSYRAGAVSRTHVEVATTFTFLETCAGNRSVTRAEANTALVPSVRNCGVRPFY